MEPQGRGSLGSEYSSTVRPAPAADASLADLMAHLAQETKRYVELQIELAKMQALQALAGGLYDAAKVAVAAGLFALAGLCLVIALALGLAVAFGSYWLGVLVTGLILLAAGGLVLWFALGTSFLLNVIPKDLLKQVRTLSRGPGA